MIQFQVPVLSAMFSVLFIGNTMTTLMVIPDKLKEKVNLKYRFMNNLRWSANTVREEVMNKLNSCYCLYNVMVFRVKATKQSSVLLNVQNRCIIFICSECCSFLYLLRKYAEYNIFENNRVIYSYTCFHYFKF